MRTKFTIWLLAFVLLMSLAPTAGATVFVSVDAQGGQTTFGLGDSIELEVRISSDESLLGWGLDLLFESSLFQLEGSPVVGSAWTAVPAADGDDLAGLAFPIGISGLDVLLASVTLRAVGLGSGEVSVVATVGDLAEGFPLDPFGFATDVRVEGAALTVIPEPAPALLILVGLAFIGSGRRRRSTALAVVALVLAGNGSADTLEDFDATFPLDHFNRARRVADTVQQTYQGECFLGGNTCFVDSYDFYLGQPSIVWNGGPDNCIVRFWDLGSSRPFTRSFPRILPSEVTNPPIATADNRPITNRLVVAGGGSLNLIDPTRPFQAATLNEDYDRIFAGLVESQANIDKRRWVFWEKYDSGCSDSEPASPPTSVFSWRPVAKNTIRFDGSGSIGGAGRVFDYLWNFGDGSPIVAGRDAAVVEHTYAGPGPYRVLLRTRNIASMSNDLQMNILVDEGIILELETPSPEYKVGTESFAKVKVTSFLEEERVLSFANPLVDSDDDAVVFVPPLAPPEGVVISEATPAYVVSVPLTALKGGVAQLSASVVARDSETGSEISVSATERVVVDPFEVTVEVSPEQFLVNETLPTDLAPECQKYNEGRGGPESMNPIAANCIAVTVTVKNVATTPVSNVEMLDAMDLSGPAIKSLDPTIIDVPLADITFIPDPENPANATLMPNQTAKYTWLLRADGGSPNLEVTGLVGGKVEGVDVRGSGTGRFKLVEDRILRFGVKELNPGRPYFSGSPIRLEGFLENLSTVAHVGVSIFPIVEDNAGRGHLWDKNEGIPPVTQFPRVADVGLNNVPSACRRFAEVEADALNAFPTGFVLPPRDPDSTEGTKVELEGVLATLCWEDLSIAKVRYVAVAYTLDTDEDGNLLNEAGQPMALGPLGIPLPDQGAPRRLERLVSQVEYVEEDDFERQISVLLMENPDLAEEVLSECTYQAWPISIACEGGRGVYSLGYGLIQMPPMLWEVTKAVVRDDIDYGVRLGHWTAEQWSNMYKAWVEEDPQAYQKLIEEAKLLTDSLVLAAVITADQQEKLVVNAANEIGKVATDYEKGNYEKLAGRLAFAAGENADALISGPLARALVAKVHRARYLTRADEVDSVTKSVQEAAEKVSKEVDEVKTSDKFRAAEAADPNVNVTTAGVAKANDPLSYFAIERWVGVSRDTVRRIEDICDRFGITVAFRSRGVSAIAKLKNGLAYLKPQAMKIKNTNELDIKYLGYPPEAKDVVVFIEPPIRPPAAVNLSRDGWANDKAMTDALDDYMANSLGKSKPPGLDDVDRRIAEATFDKRIDLEIEDFEFSSNDADEYFQIRERLRLRMQEWEKFSKPDKLGTPDVPGDWARDGIPLAFGYEANGLGAILDKLPKLKGERRTMVVEQGFRVLDESGDVTQVVTNVGLNAQGVRRKILNVAMDGPNGLRPFTGDIDFLHILDATGGIIRNPVRRFFIYLALANEVGMQHGESFTFALGKLTTRARYLNKHLAGKKGAEFLTTLSPGRVKRVGYYTGARAVLSDLGNGIRQFSPGHHFVPVTSAGQTLRAQADILKRIYKPRTWNEVTEDFFVQAAIWLAPLKKLAENTKRVEQAMVATSFDGDPNAPTAQVPQPNVTGDLSLLRPATGNPQVQPAHAIGHGDAPPIPQVPLEWQVVDVAEAMGSDGLIGSLPISAIANFPEAGSDEVEVVSLEDLEMPSSSPFFEIGQYVAINPTQPTQEINRIYSVSPLILERPLFFDHEPGEIMTVIPTAFVENGCSDCGFAAGDLDLDGDVDDDDRAILLASFGASQGAGGYDDRADLDGDGSVTFVDYQLWLESYRDELDPSPVPEPRAPLMLIVGSLALGLRWAAGQKARPFISTLRGGRFVQAHGER